MTSSGATLIKVLLIVASGVAINKLSDLFDATAPTIIVGSVLILVAMLISESRLTGGQETRNRTTSQQEVLDLIKFCLASLLLGAFLSAMWMLPVFDDRSFDTPVDFVVVEGAPYFHGFELGIAGSITLLGIWAVIRRNPPLRVFAFLASATAGMALAIAMRPIRYASETFDFTYTFLGWLLAITTCTFLVYILPDLVRLYSGFWFRSPGSTSNIQSPVGDRPSAESGSAAPSALDPPAGKQATARGAMSSEP